MSTSRILSFILDNAGKNLLEDFATIEDFIEHQTNCVKKIIESMIPFYIELIVRIECEDSKIDFRDMEYPTRAPSPIKYFYFGKYSPYKLVLVGKRPPVKNPSITTSKFFDVLNGLCKNKEVAVKSSIHSCEWDVLSCYGVNETTGNFDLVIPR